MSWQVNPQAPTMHWPTNFQEVAGAGLELSQVIACCCGVLWNLNFSGLVGSWMVCHSLVSVGTAAFFIWDWWIQVVIPVILIATGVANITRWILVQLGWSGSFYQSFTHTISPGWWGWVQLPLGIGVLSKTSWEMWCKSYPRDWRCQDMFRFPIFLRYGLSLFIMEGVCHR
jgi:hypothetical protein